MFLTPSDAKRFGTHIEYQGKGCVDAQLQVSHDSLTQGA